MTDRQHIPALDGLRGMAALLVMVFHLDVVGLVVRRPPFSGPLGVLIFFELSGFLMAHLYMWKPIDRGSAYHYLVARVARVFPLYFLVVTLAFLLSLYIGRDFIYHLTGEQYIRQMLFAGSAHVFWSIPPEVQFYFVFMGIWWLHARGHTVRFAPLLALAAALIFIARPILPGISAFGQLQVFLAGVLVAVLRRGIGTDRIDRRGATAVQALSLILLLLGISGFFPEHLLSPAWAKDDAVYASIPLVLVVAGSLFAFTVPTVFAERLFANRLARRMGAYSFSLYLTHEPILDGVRRLLQPLGVTGVPLLVVAMAAAIATAALTFHLFEMPVQRLIRGLAARDWLRARVSPAVPVP